MAPRTDVPLAQKLRAYHEEVKAAGFTSRHILVDDFTIAADLLENRVDLIDEVAQLKERNASLLAQLGQQATDQR